MCPRIGGECLSPRRHRLPRCLWRAAASLIRGPRGLQVAHRRVARDAQHITLIPLSQRLTKPRMAAQLIVAGHPTVGHLTMPRVEHLQTLLVAGVIPYLWRHMAFLASLLVSCPLLRQGQAEVEQGMLLTRDVSHEDAHLAGIDLAPVATPLALDAH